LDSSAVAKPAYWRTVQGRCVYLRVRVRLRLKVKVRVRVRLRVRVRVHGRCVYIVAYGPRVYGNSPGSSSPG